MRCRCVMPSLNSCAFWFKEVLVINGLCKPQHPPRSSTHDQGQLHRYVGLECLSAKVIIGRSRVTVVAMVDMYILMNSTSDNGHFLLFLC